MNILLIRHGPAGDRRTWTGPDSERPLTVEGREVMRLAVPALPGLVPRVDVLATSPFTRAYETAEIVAQVYDGMPLTVVDALASGGSQRELLDWIHGNKPGETLALVGHNPDLEDLAAGLLVRGDFVQLKKGAAALLEFDGMAQPGTGRLEWLHDAKELRRMVSGR